MRRTIHAPVTGGLPVTRPCLGPVLWALAVLWLLAGCATGAPLGGLTSGWGLSSAMGGAGGFSVQTSGRGAALACGGVAMPAGWPDLSTGDAEALLAPLLKCPSPGDYVALQQRVDMPRLVEALDDWRAMRLAALRPVRADAVGVLNAKRVSFLLAAAERYGLPHAEVFTLYVLHAAHDDEVDAVLRWLARDKQLGRTLGLMPAVREDLAGRGLPLSAYAERGEQVGDVLRGLGRAARDVLSTSPVSDGLRYTEMAERRGQLPAPYQDALHEVERELARRHFAPGSVAVGSFDAATFGVPLGFFYLVVGTGEGLSSLSRGEYEQATRELAPAALLVGVYAGGAGRARPGGGPRAGAPGGASFAPERAGAAVGGPAGGGGGAGVAPGHPGPAGSGPLRGPGRRGRGAGVARGPGDVALAQVWLSQAKPPRPGSWEVKGGTGTRSAPPRALAAERPGSMVSLVDEAEGLTREVVEARLALVELDAEGPRLSRDVAVLERQRPSLEAPPPGAEGNPLWGEYVTYREKRLVELKQGKDVEGPLRWEGYERMRRRFAQGLAFESLMVDRLRADAALPRAERRFLGDFDRPRIERWVGVWKQSSGLRFADVLVIEEGPSAGLSPRVETLSFKSRDLTGLDASFLRAQIMADAREALGYYGETLDIRRPSLQSLLRGGSKVPVQRVRLIYERGQLDPMKTAELKEAMRVIEKVSGVEVSSQ